MPDPSVSDALAEAYALASSDDELCHTIEIAHPSIVAEDGSLTSLFLYAGDENILCRLEADAPISGGKAVLHTARPFSFSLAPIEAGSIPELQVVIENVTPALIEILDLAVADPTPITMRYRPFLLSDLLGGPQMDPVPQFTLSSIKVGVLTVTATARSGIGDALRRRFPRRQYTAREFPGLIGR